MAAVADCATRTGKPAAVVCESAIAFWARQTPLSDASLVSDLIKFGGLFSPAPGHPRDDRGPRKLHRVRSARSPVSIEGKLARDELPRQAVAAIFDAASSLTQLYGVVFNTRIVVRHALTASADETGAREVSDLVHEASQQLRRLGGGRLHYIYRHRKTEKDGLVTGIVCHIPSLLADPMLDWIERFMERRLGSDLARRAVYARLADHGEEPIAVRRHWRLVRGLCAGLDPALTIKIGGERRPLAQVLKVPARLCRPGEPMNLAQRYRISETIGIGAQRRAKSEAMPLLSAFCDQAWDALPSGWELDEYRERIREAQERRLAEDKISALWPDACDEFQSQVRTLELEKLRASWVGGPHKRPRGWRGWWLSASSTPGSAD